MNSPREGWPEFLFSLGGKCFFPFRYRDGIFHDCVQFRVKHKWCSLNETYQGYWKYCSEEGEALAWKSRWWHWSWGSGLGVREITRGFCKGNSQSIKLWNKGCTVLWRSEKSHCSKHLSASTVLPWKETFPQNLNPSPILFCMCLWWNRVEQMGVGTCVHAHTHVCVCVCVCVMAETRYKIKRVLILIASLFSVDFAKCVFPFWYRHLIYWGCTEDGDSFGKAWCSLTRNYNKDRVWKYCDWWRDLFRGGHEDV